MLFLSLEEGKSIAKSVIFGQGSDVSFKFNTGLQL